MSFYNLLNFNSKRKKNEFFELNLKILDREEKLYERTCFYERKMKIVKEAIRILEEEIVKARKCLDNLKKECAEDKKKIIQLEKKTSCALKIMNLENSCVE